MSTSRLPVLVGAAAMAIGATQGVSAHAPDAAATRPSPAMSAEFAALIKDVASSIQDRENLAKAGGSGDHRKYAATDYKKYTKQVRMLKRRAT
jgi:hypothetical protein